MPVKQSIPYNSGTFFITFTCTRWLPLINISNGYDLIYKWFDHLKSNGHYINGYVIMPNHVHLLISFKRTKQPINTIIGNGKRFIAYEIVKRLEKCSEQQLLMELSKHVVYSRRSNKKHNVWELSFDWKLCNSDKFITQKLNYIHMNPCNSKWNLCSVMDDYLHSSAKFYETGVQGIYAIDHVEVIKDTNLDE
jgi:REP element-mobilizing transposase RayT